ncbi:hypothetical protein CSUB01_02384 [Colletotrichum sublineola]|uniref:Aminoglycoside phosphotransferase domain-containing protein n=1 Tax=Colletotrichum sublineola TaxID=1173701 RepID=A0A066XS21_COLSU|nr:hypothetical protein CSUB01_02384 [Colletotrichum sublineola]
MTSDLSYSQGVFSDPARIVLKDQVEKLTRLPLLLRSRASIPSPILTRASADDHWLLQAFRYLGNETSIRIPPYQIVTSPSTGTEAVIEDQVSGEGVKTLGEVWNVWDDIRKYRAVVQTRDMVKAMRSIKPTDIPQRPVIADRYVSRPGSNPLQRERVYRDNKEFICILRDSIAAVSHDAHLVRNAVEFVDELVASKQDLVFTHGNLTADNIYVSEWTGEVLAIANWSEAGYYPLYWEFIKAKLSYNNEENFDREGAVDIMLEPWRIELALMKPAHETMF